MAISYEWNVRHVDTYPTKDSKADVVHNVHWRLTATDGANNDSDGNPQTATAIGTQPLDTSDLSNFTAFDSLNSAKVQGWVEAALTSYKVAEIKTSLNAAIAEKVTPVSVQKVLGS
tara:strand:- start:256 stop:603 length:348 start_codon:yes stop_codon:yes gene_type:complete